MEIRICGPRDRAPKNAIVVNTTSRAKDKWKALSPFFLGPVNLPWGIESKNVENAWQFSKVYKEHLDKDGELSAIKWATWAAKGWTSDYAHRYPMGRGARPEYACWPTGKLDYIESRKQIYCPLYSEAVLSTTVFQDLKKLASQTSTLWLWDFDGYDHVKYGMALEEVLNYPRKKMGHAFVLAMLLEGKELWKN